MNKNNIFLTFLALVIIYGCSTSHPKYREGEPKSNFGYPSHKEIEKSFYLIGDAGYSLPGGTSRGLLAFKSFLDSVNELDNYAIFLGDNIYPDGMVAEGHPRREEAEYRLDAQIDAVESYDGNVIFIPGNHDWYNEGVTGLKREKNYLQEKLKDSTIFYPKPGCALKSIEITPEIQLIVVDSQWYLTNWDNFPSVNDDCPEIKTREALFIEIDSELKKNQNKTVVFAVHHPLYTNGVHGGQYNFDQHLYPSQRAVPMPILGSLVMLVRTSGGISIQDRQNNRYQNLVERLATISKKWGNVVFVSGHEHSLQYIEHEHVKQIVTGSGSKSSFVSLSNDGLFAFSGQGFAVLDVFEDGSSWASFYGSADAEPKLLYQKEVIPAPEPFNTDTLPSDFPQFKWASVYEPEEARNKVNESVWGDHYRELYMTDIKAEVVEIDTLYGGLEVVRTGGGHQTRSLRLKDDEGREYNLRAIEKSAIQFLQTVAFKDTPIQSKFQNTIAEDVLKDFYTASHPYAFLTIPTLSEAAGIFHTNPELFYVPKQEALGPYNRGYGNELYMIEERPEESWVGYESFGAPNHDIESTSGVFERLRRDEKYRLDEAAYIRARLFDMLIGDWDRHQDQWRWAEYEDEEGNHLFKPIPRDRDQAFSNFDGAFLATLRGLTGFAKQFAVYEEKIDNIKWFNAAAVGLDRRLIQNEGREEWIEQAKILQNRITDEVIEEAFSHLPEATRGIASEEIKNILKGRKANLVDIARRYYDYLTKNSIVTGTDKDDLIEVERYPNNHTRVTIFRIKDGEKAEVVNSKTYNPEYTEEILVYGLDDDDVFEVFGTGGDKIEVRIIGGQNNDIYKIRNGENVRVYDYESRPNTVVVNNGANIIFTDDYEVNVFDKDKKSYSTNMILPSLGYNPDDGFKIGIKNIYTKYGFLRNPFTSRHTIGAAYFFGTQSFDINYEGQFAGVVNEYNLMFRARITSPNYTRNFFGIGNETKNMESKLSRDYNRVRISRIGAEAGLVRQSPFGSYFQYLASFEGVKVEGVEDRFIMQEFTTDPEFFERKYFAGLEGTYRYESYDDVLNPTRGMKFELVAGGKMNTVKTNRIFGYVNPYLGFYNALSQNRKWVLHTRAQAEFNIGNEYEFYQAASLGGEDGLRGYRNERFTGKKAFVALSDLRYSFDEFRTDFLPFQIGVFAGYDIGRVWVPGQKSEMWHDSYGGGFWINGAEAINGTFNLFAGGDGLRFSFGFGVNF